MQSEIVAQDRKTQERRAKLGRDENPPCEQTDSQARRETLLQLRQTKPHSNQQAKRARESPRMCARIQPLNFAEKPIAVQAPDPFGEWARKNRADSRQGNAHQGPEVVDAIGQRQIAQRSDCGDAPKDHGQRSDTDKGEQEHQRQLCQQDVSPIRRR